MLFFRISISLLLSLFSVTLSHAEDSGNSIVLSGVVLEQGNNQLISQFASWLARNADYQLSPRYTGSYQELSDYLREHKSSIAWTCGVPFVEDSERDGQQLIAIPVFNGNPEYYSLVVTRAGRPEKTLLDFKTKVFAYSDPRSNSGFLAPSYHLKQQGAEIKEHFRYLMHTGLHEHSIEALLAGLADVAAIDEYVVVEYFKANPDAKNKLVVLERLGPFPFTPIVAGRNVSKDAIGRIQHSLITMHEDPEGANLLRKFGLDGFVVRPSSFYQPIKDMLNHLK